MGSLQPSIFDRRSTLAVWGRGRDIVMGGGSNWLVLRRPCWRWSKRRERSEGDEERELMLTRLPVDESASSRTSTTRNVCEIPGN